MAARFDALAKAIDLSAVPSGTAFTVSCWARLRADLNVQGGIWSLDTGDSTDYMHLRYHTDGTTVRLIDKSGSQPVGPNAVIDTWYFFAATKDAAHAMVLYWAAEGAGALSSASATGSTLAPSRFRLGADAFGNVVDVEIAALKVWSGAALSSSELATERPKWRAVRTTDLFVAAPLIADLSDTSGNGRTWSGGTGLTFGTSNPALADDVPGTRSTETDTGRTGAPLTASPGGRSIEVDTANETSGTSVHGATSGRLGCVGLGRAVHRDGRRRGWCAADRRRWRADERGGHGPSRCARRRYPRRPCHRG